MVERETLEVSMPVYDPNSGKLNPRELHAILQMVFADTKKLLEYRLNFEWTWKSWVRRYRVLELCKMGHESGRLILM